ncbi:restriction endonuclease [Streptomyces sp. CBMA123]|uniref:restriction endonuclease n=1 Tax=Streptomyces sp. CBMA123 TaxID=1896313 RepID=UPI001661C53B|nr:restriction endonuclease [Streptomyces sp. CBMA123]MBD0696122.1 restriction endonuclease [Streptomyces sp. CBMA123]
MARPGARLIRRPRGAREQLAAGVVGLAVAVLVVGVAQALLRSWVFLAVVSALALASAARAPVLGRARTRRLAALRIPLATVDVMDDRSFEYALRDLLVRDGWSAERVGGQFDQAADVIGHHPDLGRIVVQAKHTRVAAKVGVKVMYEVKGAAGPAHGADVAVVVTNGGLTRGAMAWGDRHAVHWLDRARLEVWAAAGVPLEEVLGLRRRLPGKAA